MCLPILPNASACRFKSRTRCNDILALRGEKRRVSSVDLYEVKEDELILLERGSDADIYFNFFIALITIAISTTATLVSATFNARIYETIFILITIVGYILGLFFFFLWRRHRRRVSRIIQTIRNRIPPENVRAEEQALVVFPPQSSSAADTTTKQEG